jgi:G3E family GTPase
VRATKSLLFSLVILSLRQPTEKLNRAAISSKSSQTLKSQQELSHWRAFNDAFRNSFRKEEEAEEEEEEEEEVDFLMVSHRGRRHRRCHRLISYQMMLQEKKVQRSRGCLAYLFLLLSLNEPQFLKIN